MPRKSQQSYADEYGVSLKILKSWKDLGAPYKDEAKMVTWLLGRGRIPAGAKNWLKARGVDLDAKAGTDAPAQDKLQSAEDFRNHCKAKLAEAIGHNDQNEIEFWAKLHLQYDESIRRSETHAAKLGIDNGTVLPRAEVERILRAVMYAGNACVQGALTSICEKLAGISEPAEIFRILKPAIVGGRLFAGFEKVKNTRGEPGLPGWVVECVAGEFSQYLSVKS